MVTAASLLSHAAFEEGRHAQAFPSFGSERTGAPVVAFCRIADAEVRSREPVMEPDALIVQDATLVNQVDLFAGLKPDGYVLVNSARTIEQLGLADLLPGRPAGRAITLAATDLAMEHVGRPVPNAVLLGGLAALTGVVHIDSVAGAIRRTFPGRLGDANVAAATAAYDLVAAREEVPDAHAG